MYSESTELFCRSQMSADEYVLWSGRPEKNGPFLSGAEIGSLLFSIVWTVIATAMCLPALKDNGGTILGLFPAIFPIVGLFLVGSHLRRVLILRNHTEYVITNKRIYRRMGKRIDNFSASIAVGYQSQTHRNGNSTITFPMAIDPSKPRTKSNGREVPRFFTINSIADVDRVQQVLSRMETNN